MLPVSKAHHSPCHFASTKCGAFGDGGVGKTICLTCSDFLRLRSLQLRGVKIAARIVTFSMVSILADASDVHALPSVLSREWTMLTSQQVLATAFKRLQ